MGTLVEVFALGASITQADGPPLLPSFCRTNSRSSPLGWVRVVLVAAEVIGGLAFQGGLQQPLGQPLLGVVPLRGQLALAGQPQVLSLGPAHRLSPSNA
ncbi:hypothetical protein ACFSJS_16365 [Streptomyces desertarenae]|uniref:Uncharacterized protein n=1 Tax=Streptomyces desertarenae TaxID=2666184 RepID=A0ABW4PPJ5_9ACTN